MSKIISGEEIEALAHKHQLVLETAKAIAEAQKDSSDKEWMLDLQLALAPPCPLRRAAVEAVIRKHMLGE